MIRTGLGGRHVVEPPEDFYKAEGPDDLDMDNDRWLLHVRCRACGRSIAWINEHTTITGTTSRHMYAWWPTQEDGVQQPPPTGAEAVGYDFGDEVIRFNIETMPSSAIVTCTHCDNTRTVRRTELLTALQKGRLTARTV